MDKISKHEDEWQRQATAAAIAEARKIALGSGPLMNVPVGKLDNLQWGWLIAAAIFGWIRTRCEQAIAEGLDQEEAVMMKPSAGEAAMVRSILPMLADRAAIDWSRPLAAWSKDDMTSFLLLAWQLMHQAEHALDQARSMILRKPHFDQKTGDPIPF
jgi:hypothetical protein